MAKKGYTPEQIINKLREAEILLNQGATIAAVSKKIGVSDHTYYRWRKEYSGMRVVQARRLKEDEKQLTNDIIALAPQVFSNSNLVFGALLHYPGKTIIP